MGTQLVPSTRESYAAWCFISLSKIISSVNELYALVDINNNITYLAEVGSQPSTVEVSVLEHEHPTVPPGVISEECLRQIFLFYHRKLACIKESPLDLSN